MEIKISQGPITRSVQLPYSVCQTAFSQASLFLDQPFPGISLRYFSITVRSFHFFWICLKVYLTITKAREKLTKRGFNRANSRSEKCIKGMPQVERANKTYDIVGRSV